MKFSWKNIENWRSPENDFCLVFWFLVFGYWVVQKNFFFGFSIWKKPRRFIWGSIYSCTMDGFFRIFKKTVSELICTRLYVIWILFAMAKAFCHFKFCYNIRNHFLSFSYVRMYVTYAHQPEMKNLEIGRGKKHEIKKFVCKYVLIYFYFFLFHLFLPTKYSYIGF